MKFTYYFTNEYPYELVVTTDFTGPTGHHAIDTRRVGSMENFSYVLLYQPIDCAITIKPLESE